MRRPKSRRFERGGHLAASAILTTGIVAACGSEPRSPAPSAPIEAPAPTSSGSTPAAAEARVPPEAVTPAPPGESTAGPAVEPAVEPPPAPERSPHAIEPGLWYADTTPPPLEGPGSLADLDASIAAAQPGRLARVVGRVRLQTRGRPRLSVGLALLVRAPQGDDEVSFPIDGDDPVQPPVAGVRGDERRDEPWAAGAIEAGTTNCDDQALPTLVLFRASHATDGSVEALAFQSLGEPCTVLGHDLVFGDLDDDRSTEIRLRTRTGDVMDMSAGRARSETLHILDVASWQVQLELEVAALEAEEVDGYGGRWREGDVTLRDLDGDGDRDLVFTHRDEDRMRNADDTDEESFRSSAHEAYTYDSRLDRYDRAESLDPERAGPSAR